jgi:cytochrome c oxidase subunit II
VLTREDYARWLNGEVRIAGEGVRGATAVSGGDMARTGREVASRHGCFNCHTLDGQPHIGPSFAGLYESSVALQDGSVVRADEAYLTRSMMEPQAQIVQGFKPVMPSFRGVLEEPEVAALLEFIKSIQMQPFAPSITLPRVVPLGSGEPQEPRP